MEYGDTVLNLIVINTDKLKPVVACPSLEQAELWADKRCKNDNFIVVDEEYDFRAFTAHEINDLYQNMTGREMSASDKDVRLRYMREALADVPEGAPLDPKKVARVATVHAEGVRRRKRASPSRTPTQSKPAPQPTTGARERTKSPRDQVFEVANRIWAENGKPDDLTATVEATRVEVDLPPNIVNIALMLWQKDKS